MHLWQIVESILKRTTPKNEAIFEPTEPALYDRSRLIDTVHSLSSADCRAENRTQCSWVRGANATSVQCLPPGSKSDKKCLMHSVILIQSCNSAQLNGGKQTQKTDFLSLTLKKMTSDIGFISDVET